MSLIKKNNELSPFYSNMLDEFLNTGLSKFEDRRGVPALNIKESDQELSLELRVPGIKKEDIRLDYQDGILTISGDRNEEKEEKDKDKYLRREFSSYSFHRSFELPEERYEVAKAQAVYKDGILEIALPKKVQKDKVSRQIEVK
ncbi:MAG: Hsp20/alpha crystallin family protein [Odoribacter sp.]